MAQMTQEEFVKKIQEKRAAYIQAAVDYMDALERLDFETAMKHAMSATDILGMDVMTYLMNWYAKADTSEIDEKYEKVTEELAEALDTGE